MGTTEGFDVEYIGNTLVIKLHRNISSLAGAELAVQRQKVIDEIEQSDVSAVVVDFERVNYFGSFVLDTLCLFWKPLRERSGQMALCNLSSAAEDVLSKSRLDTLWPIHESREAAIEAQQFEGSGPLASSDDSGVMVAGCVEAGSRLRVLEKGRKTVIGFIGGDLPPEHVVGRYLGDVARLIDEHDCRDLTIDMSGIGTVPSGFLGLVTSIARKGVQVTIRNPSAEVRDVVELTHLDQRLRFCDEEFNGGGAFQSA